MAELWQRAEKKFDYRAAAGQLAYIDPPLQIVHEHFHIEFVVVHLTARPSHPPLSKAKDDWFELFAGSSGIIFDSPLAARGFAHEEAGFFKLVKTSGQQSWGDL